jgi:tetratricopeptide (TPR) repeat protein
VLYLASSLLFILALAQSGAQDPSVTTLFQWYSKGSFDEVSAAFSARMKTPNRVGAFRRELGRRIDDWPVEASAAFVLEASAAAFPIDPDGATAILELGCKRVRRSRLNEFEREWHLAAAALLNGLGAYRLGRMAEAFVVNWIPGPEEHLRHSRARFPDEPRLLLAWGVHQEGIFNAWIKTHGVSLLNTWVTTFDSNWPNIRRLHDAGKAFEVARLEPSLFDEATLRLAAVKYYDKKPDEALKLWDEVSRGVGNPAWRYLAWVFIGRMFLEQKRSTEAEAAYRQALSINPRAQSARVAAAALSFIAGDVERSSDLINDILRGPAGNDPWAMYLAPGTMAWPQLLHDMRSRVR